MNWPKNLKSEIKLGVSLKNKTTFRVGGPAKFFYAPRNLEDLKLLIGAARKNKIKIFVIGAGSNILVSDNGVDGIVLQLSAPYFKKIILSEDSLIVGAGLMLGRVVEAAKLNSLSGLEFLIGIPGTVGGALMMNAGAWGRGIGELIENVAVIDFRGKVKLLKKKDIKFGYRRCGMGKYIILSARLRLDKKNKGEIAQNLNKYIQARGSRQDTTFPNAGCVFKNPSGESAGKLIDLCGLKGKKIGGAFISRKHANFILNKENARAQDVLNLMKLMKAAVRDKFKVNLDPEIKIWQ
ncbi:MAG: UDP-N-acetylmuramate dehydrogenase [Candidatus Omnitrophota bacterium]